MIVIGGDGTINEAVNGLKYEIPVSLLPAGTGNDYAKSLALGTRLEEQIRIAIYGEPQSVDIGICNDRKFLNGVGIGFDGQIVADMIQKRTMLHGPAKYYYHVLKNLSSFEAKNFKVEHAGKVQVKSLILLCIAKGTTFGGSFRLTPHAQLSDGLLHVCEIGDVSPSKRFMNINKLQNGTHIRIPEVEIFSSTAMIVSGDPSLNAHIDGEYFGHPPYEFKLLINGIKFRRGMRVKGLHPPT